MLLPSKDGIVCDYCATTYKDQFKYYSTRAIEYQMTMNRRSMPKDSGFYSDMCESCYKMLLKDVEKHIGKHRKDKIKCDLSNTYKSGTFVYYIMFFDLVDVDKDRGENNEVNVDKNVMDLNIINGFNDLVKRTEVTRKKIESEGVWT